MIVRLKVQSILYNAGGTSLFQFYDSPIKSRTGDMAQKAPFAFQFYDSPIKSQIRHCSPQDHLSFNSMIVRLKVKEKV